MEDKKISTEKTEQNTEESKPLEQKPKVIFQYQGKTYQDEELVSFFKQKNLISKLENKLLGDFNSAGKYELPNEILKELLALKKVIVKKEKQSYFLKAECTSHTFHFEVEVGVLGKGESFAQLYLLERAVKNLLDEPVSIKTAIVFYTDDADAFFETKIKKIFNIVTDDDDEGRKKENEVIAQALIEKIRLMGIFFNRYISQTKIRDKIYLEKILKMLAENPQNAELLKLYEELIKKLGPKLNPESKTYYHDLKEILDKVLLENINKLDNDFLDYLKKIRKVYVEANNQTVEGFKNDTKTKKVEDTKIKTKGGPGAIGYSSYIPPKENKAPSADHVSMYYHKSASPSKPATTKPNKVRTIRDISAYAENYTDKALKNEEEKAKAFFKQPDTIIETKVLHQRLKTIEIKEEELTQ